MEGTIAPSMAYKVKESVVSSSLLALGSAFELVSKWDAELKAEIREWEDGRVFALGVLPDGPAITIKKTGDQLQFVGKGIKNPDITIYFKNVDCALLPLSGQMGAHTAFIQHRAILHGSVGQAMQINRAMAIAQKFLLPLFMINSKSKRPAKLTGAQALIKARVMALLVPYLIKNAVK